MTLKDLWRDRTVKMFVNTQRNYLYQNHFIWQFYAMSTITQQTGVQDHHVRWLTLFYQIWPLNAAESALPRSLRPYLNLRLRETEK